jgi:hypothetical protein
MAEKTNIPLPKHIREGRPRNEWHERHTTVTGGMIALDHGREMHAEKATLVYRLLAILHGAHPIGVTACLRFD